MANPNLVNVVTVTADILIEAQPAVGDNDYTVPTGQAWKMESFSLCNTTASAVTISVSVRKATAGTFRKILAGYSLSGTLGADGTNSLALEAGSHIPRLLPEGGTVRINVSTGAAVDVLGTGTVLG